MSRPTTTSSLPLGGRLTLAWVRCYTAGLKGAVRDERCNEVAGDVWDHALDLANEPAVSRAIARRMLLGVPADLSWRTEQVRRHRCAVRERVSMTDLDTTGRRMVGISFVVGVLQVSLIGTALAAALLSWFPEDSSGADTAMILIALLGFLLGVWGVAALVRTRRLGCGLLAFATLLMTFPFYWNPGITALGIGLGAVHLLAFTLVRDSVEHVDAATEPGAMTA